MRSVKVSSLGKWSINRMCHSLVHIFAKIRKPIEEECSIDRLWHSPAIGKQEGIGIWSVDYTDAIIKSGGRGFLIDAIDDSVIRYVQIQRKQTSMSNADSNKSKTFSSVISKFN